MSLAQRRSVGSDQAAPEEHFNSPLLTKGLLHLLLYYTNTQLYTLIFYTLDLNH